MDGSRLFVASRPLPFGEALWQGAATSTRASILSLAEHSARLDGFFALTVVPRFCDIDPIEIYEKLGRMLLRVDSRRSDAQSGLAVLRLVDAARKLTGTVSICPGRFDGVWLLMTDMKRSSSEYRHLVDPVLNLMASRAPGAWLTTFEMRDVLYGLEDRLRLPLTAGKVISSNRDRSSIEYMKSKRTLGDVFDELHERELVLRSLDFEVQAKGSRVALAAGIDKWLRLKYRGGSSVPFDDYLVSSLEDCIGRHVRRLSVSREQALDGSPIVFRFHEDVLTERSRNQELVDMLGRLKNVSVCAFHLNPYLHLALVDYLDGSCMDIFADDPSTLSVIPGKKCSIAAVSRVFNRVYAHFASGQIADVEVAAPSGGEHG